jgi:hypothetical protein
VVTLPYSGHRRSSEAYCSLILRAPRLARYPFDLEQIILRAGKTIPLASLWPTPAAPRIPVLLECTISPRARAGVCPYKGESMYVLWRWQAERREWIEVTRCYSKQGEWFAYLHPAIVRELARSGAQPVEPDLGALSQEAAEWLDAHLRDLREDERARMLACVHDLLAARMAATDCTFHAMPAA